MDGPSDGAKWRFGHLTSDEFWVLDANVESGKRWLRGGRCSAWASISGVNKAKIPHGKHGSHSSSPARFYGSIYSTLFITFIIFLLQII